MSLTDALKSERVIKKTEFNTILLALEPLTTGHVLVLPNRYVENITELHPQESHDILQTVGYISKVIEEAYAISPIVSLNTGDKLTQPHLHFHVIPIEEKFRLLYEKYHHVRTRVHRDKRDVEDTASYIKSFL